MKYDRVCVAHQGEMEDCSVNVEKNGQSIWKKIKKDYLFINSFDYLKIKYFCSSKDTLKKDKKTTDRCSKT